MVVDDQVDIADTIAEVVKIFGHQSTVSYHPADAIALANKTAVDVFILDVGLPTMDGYALGALLKETRPKAVFIGHSAWPVDTKRELETGFYFAEYLRKPTDINQLAGVLNAVALGIFE